MTISETIRDGRIFARRLLLPGVCLVFGPGTTQAQALPFHTATAITAGFNENAGPHFVSVLG